MLSIFNKTKTEAEDPFQSFVTNTKNLTDFKISSALSGCSYKQIDNLMTLNKKEKLNQLNFTKTEFPIQDKISITSFFKQISILKKILKSYPSFPLSFKRSFQEETYNFEVYKNKKQKEIFLSFPDSKDEKKHIGGGTSKRVDVAWLLDKNKLKRCVRTCTQVDQASEQLCLREVAFLSLLNDPIDPKKRIVPKLYKCSYFLSDNEDMIQVLFLKHYPTDLLKFLIATASSAEQKTMDTSTKIDIAIKIAKLVEDLHAAGIVHRDLKPENILINNKKKELKIVLCDMGLSSWLRDTQDLNLKRGSLEYLPLEILSQLVPHDSTSNQNASPTNQQSDGTPLDIWALGCIFQLLFFGTFQPWHRDLGKKDYKSAIDKINTFHQKEPEQEGFRNLIWNMLHKNPDERPSAKDIQELLKIMLENPSAFDLS